MEPVKFEWHSSWNSAVEHALTVCKTDPLSEPELLRRLWSVNVNLVPLKICVVKNQTNDIVGVIPLKRRGKSGWQLLTYYSLPYANLLVAPGYVDETLRLLSRDVDCPNIASEQVPFEESYIRPEESWLVDTTHNYAELMSSRKYAKDDRYIRRKSSMLVTHEDKFDDLVPALNEWQRTWISRGSAYTAVMRDEMQIACEYMLETGRLKTISLYSGDKFAAFVNCIVIDGTAYNTFISVWDEYRPVYAGMRSILDTISWACSSDITTLDLLRTSSLPKYKWAEPVVKSYRMMRCPLGSSMLGNALGTVKDISHEIRTARTNRLQSGVQASRSKVTDAWNRL